MKAFRLIVGLGNPSRTYHHTYHNVGRRFVEYVANETGSKIIKKSPLFSVFRIPSSPDKQDIIYGVIPHVFMNESGEAVKACLRMLECSPRELLVAHDDTDLSLGKSRISWNRGSAGHRGVASIIHSLGTQEFSRLRIGVRSKKGKAETFVLSQISKEEEEILALASQKLFRDLFGAHIESNSE